MRSKLTPDEFFKLFGKLFAGLSDQYTVIVRSRAGMPYIDLIHALRLPTHSSAYDCEQAAREVFKPMLKAAEVALTYFEQCVMNCDPDEDEPKEAAMLRDAINNFYERTNTQ